MLLFPALVALVLTSPPIVSEVPCEAVADCWLDGEGNAIPRPKKYQGKALPRGDCGRNLTWLRRKLTCEENRCTVRYLGDRC